MEVIEGKALDTLIALDGVQPGDHIKVGERHEGFGYYVGHREGRWCRVCRVESWDDDESIKVYRLKDGFGVLEMHIIGWKRGKRK